MSSTSATPQSWDLAPQDELSKIQGICLDIDDTLSSHGKLTAEAYSALWRLKAAGLYVVPITGRPAGWCDHFARFWPIDAIVGENGAFTFFMRPRADGQGLILDRLSTPGSVTNPAKRMLKLEELRAAIEARFPHVHFASDQAYREHDLAIDFCEDVKPWPQADIDSLVQLCENHGAHAKVSSIHVNTWFGEFDKVKGFNHYLSTNSHLPGKDHWLFIGDSPNDEPMFSHFPHSVGVANIQKFIQRLKHPPKWITSAESGQGFVEMTERVLATRNAHSKGTQP